jgi:hypothetical protein
MGVRRAVALVLLDTEVEVAPGFRTPARAALAVAGVATAGVCRLLQPPAAREAGSARFVSEHVRALDLRAPPRWRQTRGQQVSRR